MNRNRLLSVTLIIFCFLLVSYAIFWLARSYPVATGSKDWLDVLSSVGEAAGIVALVGLVFEVYRREEEKKRQRIPLIEFGAISIENTAPPENAICCLCEEFERDLPPKEDDDDYREMWFFLKPNSKDHFLRVPITNKQLERDGRAEDFRFRIQLDYAESASYEDMLGSTKIFWCPSNEISVPPGKTITIYVRCGKPNNDKYNYIKGSIFDYNCRNARGDSFIGSKMGFEPRPIYPQMLARAELTLASVSEE